MAKHRVVSFLGSSDYEERRHRFIENDWTSASATVFLDALLAYLREGAEETPADEVLIIGGAYSRWATLTRCLTFKDASRRSEWQALATTLGRKACTKQAVTHEELTTLQALLSQPHLAIRLALLDDPASEDAGQTILGWIAQGLDEGDEVTLDVTHGFRHMPMLALLAALYLQRVKKVKVAGIYYALLDASQQRANAPIPVTNLKALLELANWIYALGQFDTSGDVAVFEEALTEERVASEVVGMITVGGKLERATRTSKASKLLGDALQKLHDAAGPERPILPRTGGLFAPSFEAALEWTKPEALSDKQRALALWYLERENWPRAAAYLFEAFRSRLVEWVKPRSPRHVVDTTGYEDRNAIEQAFLRRAEHKEKKDSPQAEKKIPAFRAILWGNSSSGFSQQQVEAFNELKSYRNPLAHAGPADGTIIEDTISNPEELSKKLRELDAVLFPQPTTKQT